MSVVEEELCRTITLIANNYQKVSNRISNIKKPQKVYEKRSIPSNECIVAYCEGTLPLLRMVTDFVVFTNRAFYPSDLGGLASKSVPYGELWRYIVTQDDDKASVYLRNSKENYMIYSSTLFSKNVGGCEIKTLLEEIQAYSCLHDDSFRSKYQKTIEDIYEQAKEERCKGDLSEGIKAALLSFAAKGSADGIHFLAESRFRLCDADKYPEYIQKLPISEEMKQKYAKPPEAFYDSLKNDLANPACAFSDAYLNGIITAIEKQKNIYDAEKRYYRIVKAFALSRIDPITAREEYQELRENLPDENWNVLEDMIHLYGSKHMSRIYDQLSRGDDVSTECFQYVDGLNLTPMHYALMLGKDEIAIAWAENKKCSFASDLEYTSEIGIWAYGVLAEIVQSKITKKLLLRTVPEFLEIQEEIKRNEGKLLLCQVKRKGLKTISDKVGKALWDVQKDDPELSLKTKEEKKRIKSVTADYEAQIAALAAINEEIETLERENSMKQSDLDCGCRNMLRSIDAYLNALPAEPSPMDSFIMQVYKQQVDLGDILRQTDTGKRFRMYYDKGFSLLLPDSIHLDMPYRIVRITKSGIEDCAEDEETENDDASAEQDTEEFECPEQPFPDSWFSAEAHQSVNTLKSEYRAYAKKYHPDVCENEEAHKAFLTIKEEYEIILNEIS